jgi:hypothetical protein
MGLLGVKKPDSSIEPTALRTLYFGESFNRFPRSIHLIGNREQNLQNVSDFLKSV